MSYVMVPVPEDRVADVMQYVVRLMAQASLEDWTEASITQLFDDIDEPSRALLSTVASASLAGERLTEPDARARVELSWRETMGLVRELNDIAREENHPPLVLRRTVDETLPNGRTREVRLLVMPEEIARLVHEADRAHLLAGRHPLDPDLR